MMVQPAFVVIDRSGEVKQAWSWNTEELADVEPKEELKLVSAYGGSPLVSVRPETADIGPSIREGRRVRLKGMGKLAILKESFKNAKIAEESCLLTLSWENELRARRKPNECQ